MAYKTEKFSCPKCEQNITFSYSETHFTNDADEVTGGFIDTDYKQCTLFLKADKPIPPTLPGIITKECPVYVELTSRRVKPTVQASNTDIVK